MRGVAMLLSNTEGSVGGTQRQASLLASALGACGLEVVILGKAGRLLPGLGDKAGGVRRLALPTLRWLPSWSLLVAFLLWAIARRDRFQVIHAQSTSAGVIAGLVGRLLGKPVVVKVTEMKYLSALDGRARSRRVRRWVLTRTASAIVSLSREMTDALGRLGIRPELIAEIPNGVEPDAPVSAAQRAALRREWALPPSAPVVVSVGRLTDRKRVDLLLEVWRRLGRRDALLLVVGDGPLRGRLEAQAATMPGVRFLGMRADVRPFYRLADVFVLASRSEGLSNALLEAMASGLPVVVSDIPGNRDVVEDGRTGVLLDWTRADACAARLRTVLENADLRRRLGAAARRRAADFAIDVVARRYCALYRTLLAGTVIERAPTESH